MKPHTKFQAPAPNMNSSQKRDANPPPRRMLPTDQRHLLKHLEVVQRTWEGSLFLNETHRKLLKELNLSFPIRPYPTDMAPQLTLDIIRLRLKSWQYRYVEEFQAEIERLFHSSAKKWGRDHYITKAAGVVLTTMKEAIKGLPDRKPTVTKTGKRKLDDIALEPTEITSEHKLAVLVEIAQIKGEHENAPLFPEDDSSPIMEVTKIEQDLSEDKYDSVEKLSDDIFNITDKSEDCNGPHHRITRLVYRLLKRVMELIESEQQKVETQSGNNSDTEVSSDTGVLVSKRVQTNNAKQQQRILDRQSHYRSGRTSRSTRNPRNLVADKIEKREEVDRKSGNKAGKSSYVRHLKELSKQPPTQQQIDDLCRTAASGPIVLGRTASQTDGGKFGFSKKSNGSTTHDILMPAVDTRLESEEYQMHTAITDFSQGEIIYMCGKHLAWDDLRGDELLSYSMDPLFLVVHALGRYHGGEGNVTIQFLDRRKATTPEGGPASFYSALDVYTIFEVPRWEGWGEPHKKRLQPRKFTQEYLTHGPVLYADTTYMPARIDDLIRDGLYEISPEFHVAENVERIGLYTAQVVYRKNGYRPKTPAPGTKKAPIYSYEECSHTVPMTAELLETVRKVTLNFCNVTEVRGRQSSEPPLHAFICFLTFEKRQCADPTFTAWIAKRYTGIFTSISFDLCSR
jgi:hypothetical protein